MGVWCGGLMYADDFVLMAETEEQLQEMLSKRVQYRLLRL